MIRKALKFLLLALLSFICSAALIFSVTVANFFAKGGIFRERKYTLTEIKTVPPERIKQKPEEKEPPRKAMRAKTTARTPKAGPRFAMALGTVGSVGGAVIPQDYIAESAGGGGEEVNGAGDVDEKPSGRGYPQFQPPQSIRDAEQDASLRLSFCVDASGKVYNVRVVEESPAGKGLSQAGIEALSRMTFTPAKKDGRSVPYCGMEQPFEVKFRD
jgi:protein TonB